MSEACIVAEQIAPSQEFIELVRQGKMMLAINYAKGHLASWASVYLKDLQVDKDRVRCYKVFSIAYVLNVPWLYILCQVFFVTACLLVVA